MPAFFPAYLSLHATGELSARARTARERLAACDLCPRRCGVSRLQGTEGAWCRSGERAVVNGFGAHHGEEDCLRGTYGSGTIFFSYCNLGCVFCQNSTISHDGCGHEVDPDELATMMLALQAERCHNINLVSPSHVVAPILAAVEIATGRGLRLPLVYNSGGYDSVETLRLLDGVVDIYMPDMKYGDSRVATQFSQAPRYVEVNQAAVREMHRQVGDLVVDAQGVAQRGLLVRHLVLPAGLAGSEHIFAFLASDISRSTWLNVMDQYHPCHDARLYPQLDRLVTARELEEAMGLAERHGLHRLDRRPRHQISRSS